MVLLAALISIPARVGYAAVFGLIAVETMGIPVPGETALIAAALLAHRGDMDIVTLIAVAAAAAIVGDNIGFAFGRSFGRRVFLANGPFFGQRRPRCSSTASRSSPSTGRRPYSSAAGCRGCGSRRVAGRDEPHALADVPVLERARRHLPGP